MREFGDGVELFAAIMSRWFGPVEVQGDFMVSDDVAMGADSLEVGALFSGAEGEFPEPFPTRIVSF